MMPKIDRPIKHPDEAKDGKLRAMLGKGRKPADVAKLDLSTRRKRLAILGVDEATYRACGGTIPIED